MSDLTTADLTTADLGTAELSIAGPQQPSARRTGWLRDLTVTTVVVLLIGLSFVLGRASNTGTGGVQARTGQPATAGLSIQAELAAQARLLQSNGTEVSDSRDNVLSLCRVGVPC